MNKYKIIIWDNIQNVADLGLLSSSLVLSMMLMYCALKTMDAEYNPNNKINTKIPNVGESPTPWYDIKTTSMQAKYNNMHESCTMEETAVMLSLDAMSITHFTMYPVIGKYCNVFKSAGRMAADEDDIREKMMRLY